MQQRGRKSVESLTVVRVAPQLALGPPGGVLGGLLTHIQ
jgi:hypothetical protein